jgi:putative nucleotidyltransferase with HDIG domain
MSTMVRPDGPRRNRICRWGSGTGRRTANLPAMSTPLERALTEPVAGIRRLPEDVETLLYQLEAPPRLGAHLRAVHDVACQLTDALADSLVFDRDAVRWGAATHDVGKVIHPAELSGPGVAHERTGYDLLIACGYDERLARFARDHGSWSGPDVSTESLLVSLADKVWKGKRVPDLEDNLVARIGGRAWEVFLTLDDILARIADAADARLEFQNRHPV